MLRHFIICVNHCHHNRLPLDPFSFYDVCFRFIHLSISSIAHLASQQLFDISLSINHFMMFITHSAILLSVSHFTLYKSFNRSMTRHIYVHKLNKLHSTSYHPYHYENSLKSLGSDSCDRTTSEMRDPSSRI
jgi:hypothetical protein